MNSAAMLQGPEARTSADQPNPCLGTAYPRTRDLSQGVECFEGFPVEVPLAQRDEVEVVMGLSVLEKGRSGRWGSMKTPDPTGQQVGFRFLDHREVWCMAGCNTRSERFDSC